MRGSQGQSHQTRWQAKLTPMFYTHRHPLHSACLRLTWKAPQIYFSGDCRRYTGHRDRPGYSALPRSHLSGSCRVSLPHTDCIERKKAAATQKENLKEYPHLITQSPQQQCSLGNISLAPQILWAEPSDAMLLPFRTQIYPCPLQSPSMWCGEYSLTLQRPEPSGPGSV